jgi:hypothetical protein
MLQQTTYSVTLGIGLIFVYCITLHYKLFLYADFANSVHKYNKITHLQYFGLVGKWIIISNSTINLLGLFIFLLVLSLHLQYYFFGCN